MPSNTVTSSPLKGTSTTQVVTASSVHQEQKFPSESAAVCLQDNTQAFPDTLPNASVYKDSSSQQDKNIFESASASAGSSLSIQNLRTREDLSQEVQQIIEEINNKRKDDSNRLADFKNAFEMHVQKTCSLIEQNMFDMYETQSAIVQSKLQELFVILDHIAKLEAELAQFKMALGNLYNDVI